MSKNTAKFRPYLSESELYLISSLLSNYRNELTHSETELAIANTALRAIQKTYINATTGTQPAYIQPHKATIEEQLGLTTSDFPTLTTGVKTLTDDEKLELMLPSERAQYWIKFNKDNFGIEPTPEQLAEVEQLKQQEAINHAT